MSWKQINQPKSVTCTKALVQEFAEMEPCPGDRPFRMKIAKVLKLAIIKDTFRVANFASVYVKATKQTYRVNGKHTSMVLNDLAGRFPKGLHAIVERYEADTLEDAAVLYATFDHKQSLRSTSDVNRIFSSSSADLSEIPARIINACASGLGIAVWEQDVRRHEAEERANLLLTHRDFVAWVAQLCPQDKKYRHLLRGAVVAAMFRTFQKTKKAASEFWQLVAEESHPSNKHPSRVLARWLLTHDVYAGAHHSGRQQLDSTRGMFVQIGRAHV